MDKEELHAHIADMLERIAHLNKSLAGTNKVLPVEVDLLKGYMAELDKSFEALTKNETITDKTLVNAETEIVEVEEAPEMETTVVVDEVELQAQETIEEEVVEEPVVEAVEVGYEEPVKETEEQINEVEESEEREEPFQQPVDEKEQLEDEPIVEQVLEHEPVLEKEEEQATEPNVEPEPIELVTKEPEAEPEQEVVESKPQQKLYEEDDNESTEDFDRTKAKGAASLNERFSKREGAELGYKIKAPLQSLKAMIDLSEKYVYTKELFGGDKDHFESTLKYLDQCKSLSEANAHINEVVKPRFKWDDKIEVEKRFRVLLEQRFN